MPRYVDGFVIPIQKRKLKSYLRMAKLGAQMWKDHGALEYHEYVGEDLSIPFGMGFPKMTKLKAGETVVFSWIVFKSRAHRDKVNAAVMSDPRMGAMEKTVPFDPKRLAVGGFTALVEW